MGDLLQNPGDSWWFTFNWFKCIPILMVMHHKTPRQNWQVPGTEGLTFSFCYTKNTQQIETGKGYKGRWTKDLPSCEWNCILIHQLVLKEPQWRWAQKPPIINGVKKIPKIDWKLTTVGGLWQPPSDTYSHLWWRFFTKFQGSDAQIPYDQKCGEKPPTVDGSEIWGENQLRLVVEIKLFTTGFKNIPSGCLEFLPPTVWV